MSVTFAPESRRPCGLPRVRGAEAGQGRRSHGGTERYEPYPSYRYEISLFQTPGHVEEVDQEESKPQIMLDGDNNRHDDNHNHHPPQQLRLQQQQQQSHPGAGAEGYHHYPPSQPPLLPHGDGSATYIAAASASYMCNPPSRDHAGAGWPLPSPYMTNAAEGPQPLAYDAHAHSHRVSSNHDVTCSGFGTTPLYYSQPANLGTLQYAQSLPVHGYPAHCMNSTVIGGDHSSSLAISRAPVDATTQIEPPVLFYASDPADSVSGPPPAAAHTRRDSSETSHPAVADASEMEVGKLVNPIVDEDEQISGSSGAEQSRLSVEPPLSIEDVETTDSVGADASAEVSDEMLDIDGEGDYVIEDNKTPSASPTDGAFAVLTSLPSSPLTGRSGQTSSKSAAHPSQAGPRPPKAKKKQKNQRGPFTNQERRAETAATRRRRACTRCRQQKARCDQDPLNPGGECLPCKEYNKQSRKTIHRAPCHRGKLTDAVLVRQGGLNLTQRWQGAEMKNVTNRPSPNETYDIEYTLGTCVESVKIKVVRFVPIPGDVLERVWVENGRRKKVVLEPFCLVDINATAVYFEDYIKRNAIPTFLSACSAWNAHPSTPHDAANGMAGNGTHSIVDRTYRAAWQFYDALRNPNLQDPSYQITNERAAKERLLSNLFVLWFASRHTTGSSYICGQETLGMKPYTKNGSYPLYGKISLPRMIIAQFDSIMHTRILQRYSKDVLKDLEYFINRKSEDSWWTVYICLFILLREASYLTADRYRHARNNFGDKIRYTCPGFVEELQLSCTLLVQHWHYYNTRPWPDPTLPHERHKSSMSLLTAEQYRLVLEAMRDPTIQRQLNYRRVFKANNDTIPDDANVRYNESFVPLDWDDPLFWVSQLFEEDWRPQRTYQREPLPKMKPDDDQTM